MLIGNEIWAAVEQENLALRPFQLHNTTIVVNAFDFMVNISRTKTDLSYGGEYSSLEEKFENILNNYHRCNIKPIFVFGGVSSYALNTLTRRLLILQKRLSDLDRVLQEISEEKKSSDVKFFICPVFAKEALMATLSRLNVPHVTCDSDAVQACVALAARLRCPVIADSGDFLLYEFEEPIDNSACFNFVPQRLLSSQAVPHPTKSGSFCLLGRVFYPSTSGFHQVAYNLRPFFALYLGPPSEARFPLPGYVTELKNGQQNVGPLNSAQLAAKRVTTLIKWLESTKSPLNALADCVEQLNGEEIVSEFIHRLASITSALTIDLDQGGRLLSYLFPDAILRDPEFTTSTDLITWFSNEQNIPEPLRPFVSLLETEYTSSIYQIPTFFSQISPTLLRFYRSGIVSPVMLSRLFSSVWVLYPFMENSARDPITDCARGLRYLQYCLILGFTRRHKVEIANWNEYDGATVSEVSRTTVPSNLCKVTYKLQPFYPSSGSSKEDCVCFVSQNLGYELKVGDDWVQSLALSLAVWHAHTRSGERFDLLNQPTALAIALLACVMEASNGHLNSQHLEELADTLACEFNIDVVHDLNQFQLVYLSLVSLFRLLDVIVECSDGENESSALLSFLPASRVLPHCRLAHNLTITLSNSVAKKEISLWLKKLLSPLDDIESTKKAERYMMHLVGAVYKMTNVHQITFESHVESLPFSNHCGKKWPPKNDHVLGKKVPQREFSRPCPNGDSSRVEFGQRHHSSSSFTRAERGMRISFGSPNNDQYTPNHDCRNSSRPNFRNPGGPRKFNRRDNCLGRRDENPVNYNLPGGVHRTTEYSGNRNPSPTHGFAHTPEARASGAPEISGRSTNPFVSVTATSRQSDFGTSANQHAELANSTTLKNPFISDFGTTHKVHEFQSSNEGHRSNKELTSVGHSSASVLSVQSSPSPPLFFSSGQKYSGRRFAASGNQTQNQPPFLKYGRSLNESRSQESLFVKIHNKPFCGENTKTSWAGVRKQNPPQNHRPGLENEWQQLRNVGHGQRHRFGSSQNKPQNNQFGDRNRCDIKPRPGDTSGINQKRPLNKPSGGSTAKEWSKEAITDALNKLTTSFE